MAHQQDSAAINGGLGSPRFFLKAIWSPLKGCELFVRARRDNKNHTSFPGRKYSHCVNAFTYAARLHQHNARVFLPRLGPATWRGHFSWSPTPHNRLRT
jgi:hypothetical protein